MVLGFLFFSLSLPAVPGNYQEQLGKLDSGTYTANRINDNLENNGMIVSHRITGSSGMEWPAGTNKFSNFASGIWFAGMVNGSVRTAVGEYGPEFVPGPWDADFNADEHQLYIVNKSDLANPLESSDFQNWPVALGAPWVDEDDDGFYSPLPNGPDHPDFIGDQVIWYVINDSDVSTHANIFGTQPLGIEVRMTIWGYNRPDAFGDMMFVKVQAFNKGGEDITDMYIGLWDDPDLGFAGDDFVGCDTTLSLGFCYNDGSDDDYGDAAPAIGYDFFQASVLGNPDSTSFFFGEDRAGYENLPMSSFTKYINGSTVFTDPNDETEAYNYMSGNMRDGSPFINSATGEPGKFVHPCDPNENIDGNDDCWVDSDDNASGDRRFLMNVGPFNFAQGDSLELVFGIMMAQANDPLSSVTLLKQEDELAQLAYDINFALPPSPPQPEVTVTSTFEEIILSWDDAAESYVAEDQLDLVDGNPTYFNFEGYNVWQLDNISGTGPRQLVATYDLVNGLTTIYDPNVFDSNWGVNVNVPVQQGSDSGIQRWISIDKDKLNGGTALINDRAYYFSVSAYGYNEDGIPRTLESPDNIFLVRPSKNVTVEPLVDSGYSEFDVTHNGPSDGSAEVIVVDPYQLTGDSYRVEFGYYLYMADLGYDAKDCAGEWYKNEDGATHAIDCAGNCGDLSWIGDGWCDDPASEDYYGQYWNCEEWNYDNGDCDPGRTSEGVNDRYSNIPAHPSLREDDEPSNFIYWRVYDETTQAYVTDKEAVQSGVNMLTGETEGDYVSHTFDGLQIIVNGPSEGIHGIWQISNGNGEIPGVDDNVNENILWINFLTAPDYPTEQAQTGWFFVTHGGGTANDLESFYARVFRGSNFSRAIPFDFEMRFTTDALANGMGYRRFEDEAIIGNVPFELWNIGMTPDDPSDDYRMLPAILNGAGLGAADDNIDAFDFWGDDPSSGADNDPSSDWVYWGNPDDMTAGSGGYDSFFAPGIGNTPSDGWTEVLARTRVMNWNAYVSTADSMALSELSDPDPANWTAADTTLFVDAGWFIDPDNSKGVVTVSGDYAHGLILGYPEVGTTFRWITNKPNSDLDTFTFSTSDVVPGTHAFDCSAINVWPNPYFGYNPEERTPVDFQLHFTDLSDDATIRIYNLAGHLVRKLDHTSGQQEIWNLQNNFGLPVASGMYIAVVETAGCNQVLKIAVEMPEQRIDVY